MYKEKSEGIWVITDETDVVEEAGSSKARVDTGADYVDENQHSKIRKYIKAEDLKSEMSEFLDVIEDTFNKVEKPSSKIQLEELELSVEVNGKGQISLLGTGAEAGAKGAIRLKFKRKHG